MLTGIVLMDRSVIPILGALTGGDNKRTIVSVKQTINNFFRGRSNYVAIEKKVGWNLKILQAWSFQLQVLSFVKSIQAAPPVMLVARAPVQYKEKSHGICKMES